MVMVEWQRRTEKKDDGISARELGKFGGFSGVMMGKLALVVYPAWPHFNTVQHRETETLKNIFKPSFHSATRELNKLDLVCNFSTG